VLRGDAVINRLAVVDTPRTPADVTATSVAAISRGTATN
jgi:hypothetical protein